MLTIKSCEQVRGVHPQPDLQKGFYRHYKGGTYEAYGLSQREDDGTWEVLYRNPRSGQAFHRPFAEFAEKFEYLGSEFVGT